MIDVLLVSMPFGPLMSPSLGLSLLQPQVVARGLTCRIEYFTLPFAERIGEGLYSKITTQNRAMSRAFVGEWIFSHALFDWDAAHDERYLTEVLFKPPSWLGRNPTRPPSPLEVRGILAARDAASAFVDWCAERIVEAQPRIVGFTSVFQQHLASLALAKRVKAALPGVYTVIGGANCEATMGVETVRQFPFVDAVVSGEADRVFAELALQVTGHAPRTALHGVITRAAVAGPAGCTTAPTAPAVSDLDALPYPDYKDFFDQFAGSRFARAWQPSVYVETSRGCWWGERMHCTFCGLNGETMAYRSKSAPRALAELTHLASSYPGCDIQVVDNILDLKYFKTLLPELAERKLNVSLFYETKSNLKKDQVRLLRDAGVLTIQPGIESFSDRVLKQMKKGVSGLQNIQLLKWCKEIGVQPIWNFLIGFPQESPDDYFEMAGLTTRVCHLPRPAGVSMIRLDRFSPNFNEAGQLGFTKLQPVPFYEFLYDLPEAARRNLAYYFSYDYKVPQHVARYAEPLVRSVHAWKTTWRNAELVSVDLDDRLFVFDTRPRTEAPISVLTGEDRDLYLACDAIADGSRLEASGARRLQAMTDRGLMLSDGAKYLSLAVPLGEYAPSGAAAARLRAMFAAAGTRRKDGVRIAFDADDSGAGARDRKPRPAGRSALDRVKARPHFSGTPLTKAHFELSGTSELFVRRSVS
jgi:ribosomal peptide maturation radical SAM protein 1